MSKATTPAVVLLHGLPKVAPFEPSDHFKEIIAMLRSLFPADHIMPYPWWADVAESQRWSTRIPAKLAVSALHGKLGSLISPEFERWLYSQPLIAGGTKYFVIAYSAGGWGFYDWLEGASTDARAQIECAFTITAPFRNVHPHIYLDNEARPASPWHLDHRKLATALRPGRLHILWSDIDRTAWPNNALLSKADPPLPSAHLVTESLLPNVLHDDACRAERTVGYIRDRIAEILTNAATIERGYP